MNNTDKIRKRIKKIQADLRLLRGCGPVASGADAKLWYLWSGELKGLKYALRAIKSR